MNKQKQIEEMTEEIEKAKQHIWASVRTQAEDEDYLWHSRAIAEHLTSQGYRKVDKDSIVLSREESQALKKQIEYWEYETKVAREEIDNAGKETAKEILNELIDSSNKITFFDCRMALGLDKLAKQYGVEVEE